MPLLELTVLAVVAMTSLAALRLARVHVGRSPLPEARGRRLFLLAFVVVPPIALGALTPAGAASQLRGVTSLPVYVSIVAALVVLMAIAALIVGQLTHGPSGRLARLALVGSEGDPDDFWSDPPLTAKLAESVGIVDMANAAFPRGVTFAGQIGRAGFRVDWDALDGATRALEGRIADDDRLGRAVASAATAVAKDARSRLDTLRTIAVDHGQAWAAI
jgi:hypothetical protein